MAGQRLADDGIHEQAGMTLKRRGILAAAGAVVAGIVAKQAADPVAAVNPPLLLNQDNAATAATSVTVSGSPSNGFTVTNVGFGSTALSGAGGTTGVAGTGSITGVAGTSAGVGVHGTTTTMGAVGVRGNAPTTGASIGVEGDGDWAVVGYGGSIGVSGYGSLYGTFGRTNTGSGVYGDSDGGNGVFGYAISAGTSAVVAGVMGTSASTYGIIGNTTAAGYSGLTAITSTPGVAALAATSTSGSAYAAYFQGTTVVQGDFVAFGGSKSAAVKDASGQHRLVYCVESPEAWFEDFGSGKLVGGKASVTLDPVFTQIAHTDDYHVHLTPQGDTSGLHVASQSASGFTVTENKGGASTIGFRWRVVAKRADIKGQRLAKFTLPKIKIPDESKLPKPEPPKKP